MTCGSVMWPTPTTLTPETTIQEALQKILQVRVRSLPVVDLAGKVVGVFGVHTLLTLVMPKVVSLEHGLWNTAFMKDSIADLKRRLGKVSQETVSGHMRTRFEVVHPDSPLTQTVALLHQGHDSIPVVDRESGELLGVLTYWHVLDAMQGGPGGGGAQD